MQMSLLEILSIVANMYRTEVGKKVLKLNDNEEDQAGNGRTPRSPGITVFFLILSTSPDQYLLFDANHSMKHKLG